MPDYRLYVMDSAGRFQQAHDLYAQDDASALEACRRMAHGQRSELWSRARLVAVLQAEDAPLTNV